MAVVAACAYALDMGTKAWAVRALEGREPIPVIGDLLQLNLVFNPGAAFSTGTQFTVALAILACVAIVVVIYLARRVANTVWAIGLGLLLGGVGGNFTDRLIRDPGPFRGHVVDFLQLPHWPVFNVADMCIDAAAAIIIIQTLRGIGLDGRRSRDDDPHAADVTSAAAERDDA